MKLDAIIEMVKEKTAGLKEAMVLEELHDHLTVHLPGLLREVGKEKLIPLVKSGGSLWQAWESASQRASKREILAGAEEYREQIRLLRPEGVAGVMQEVIGESCPEFRWLPLDFMVRSLLDFKADMG